MRNFDIGWTGSGLVLFLAVLTAIPLVARADATVNLPVRTTEFPKVVFLLDRHETMAENWGGDATLPTRWDAAVQAIVKAVNSAPPEMEFAVVGTSDSVNHWFKISSFDHDNVYLTNTLVAHPAPSISQPLTPSADRAAQRCDRPEHSSTRHIRSVSPEGSLTAPALNTELTKYGQSRAVRMGFASWRLKSPRCESAAVSLGMARS